MVNARFINDTKSVEIRSEDQKKSVNLNSTARHDTLIGRNLPNQHSIDSITGLRDILNNVWTVTFEQEIPTAVWEIHHNLGRTPSVVVVDSGGSVQIPDEITYNSENQITLQFISAFAGKAYLN